jgi:hypothetical protein
MVKKKHLQIHSINVMISLFLMYIYIYIVKSKVKYKKWEKRHLFTLDSFIH